jgi:hypothetical protein
VAAHAGRPPGISAGRRKRLIRIADMYERGISDPYQIGAAFGITSIMAGEDLRVIRKEWLAENKQATLVKRAIAVKRVESLLREARNGFDRSRMDAEEIQYREQQQQCVACRGTGKKGADLESDEWCDTCEGEGEVRVGVTTTLRRGQPGDPRFLKVAHGCLAEINRLNGIYKQKVVMSNQFTIGGDVIHAQLGSASEAYLKAPMETLIEVKTALAKLYAIVKMKEMATIDGRVEHSEEEEVQDADDSD